MLYRCHCERYPDFLNLDNQSIHNINIRWKYHYLNGIEYTPENIIEPDRPTRTEWEGGKKKEGAGSLSGAE